tara:strand:- start:578 stop:691 length:114 start_codon:yes stop_codon:yes gene_type:complete
MIGSNVIGYGGAGSGSSAAGAGSGAGVREIQVLHCWQ